MRARFDGICVKCGEAIKGFTNHPTCDDIAWTRKPRKDGLRSAAWHVRCEYKLDNPQVVAALLEKQNKRLGDTPTPDFTPVPVPAPAFNVKLENGETMANGDFLAGMADALVPHLTGKLSANLNGIEEKLDGAIKGLDSKLQEMIDKSIKTIVVENKSTGETKNIGKQHKLFPKLLSLAQMRMDTYLYGPAGSGKSKAGECVAEALDLPFGYISLTIQTSESRIVGYMDATGNYIETEFYRRYTQGGVYVIDEIDNASGNLLTALNSALANGNGAFPCGQVKRHKDFICIVNGNTCGFGRDPKYPERQTLSGPIRDRFTFIHWTYDEPFERELALAQHENKTRTSKWVEWVQRVRKYAEQYDPKLDTITPRASIKGATLLDEFNAEETAHMLVFKGYDKDSVTRILSNNPLPVLA